MMFSTGSITVVNSNLNTGVATAGSTVGLNNLGAQGTTAIYSPTRNAALLAFQVTGTWTGTLVVQESIDGVNWVNNGVVTPISTGTPAVSLTANGIYTANISGSCQVRLTASAAVTGTAVVSLYGKGQY